MEKTKAKEIGIKVIREKWCQICGGVLSSLGATIKDTKLYGCPDCRAVYWI